MFVLLFRFPEEDLFRDSANAINFNKITYPTENMVSFEQPQVHENIERAHHTSEGRNFAWSEEEKNEKT